MMYCSSCGVAVANGLSFCNYCGTRLPSTEAGLEFQEVRPQLLVSAMAGLFILGMPGIVFLIFMLNAVGLHPKQAMAFAWASFSLLVALEAVFLFLLLRRKPREADNRQANQFKGPQTKELEGGALAGPVPSVTEHTTRAFEAMPRERR